MPAAISRHELSRRIEEKSVVVVEALSSDFFLDGHLPGAVNLPLATPDDVLARVATCNALSIVVYGSRTGPEAAELARRIESIGKRSVLIYEGGKEDWAEAGLKVEWS